MAKFPKIVYDCKNLSVQDLINFCNNHNLPLTTQIYDATGLCTLELANIYQIAIVDKKIVLFNND